MASKKVPDPDGKAIAKAIADALPGWTLSRKEDPADDETKATPPRAQPGASLSDLRKKFLGTKGDVNADALGAAGVEDYGVPDKGRITVRVEPLGGGPSKVADISDGEAEIVQG